MQTFTIVETRNVRSMNPANATGYDTLVTYTDQAERIHSITVPGSDLDEATIDAAIQSQHADRTKHTGRTIDA